MDKKVEEILKNNDILRTTISGNLILLEKASEAEFSFEQLGLPTPKALKDKIEELERQQKELLISLEENTNELKNIQNNCQHEFVPSGGAMKCSKCGLIKIG